MVFKNVTPILFSKDISQSLQFYTTVFGFDRSWHFGNPPDFGAVIKDSVEVFFSTGGQSNPGFCIYLVVDDIDTLHKRIVDNGGKVLSPPANYEWGMRELLVEDMDGNFIRFGQYGPHSDRQQSAANLPQNIRIRSFIPTEKTILDYVPPSDGKPEEQIIPFPAAVYAAVAEDSKTGRVVGSVYLIGEKEGFYYVRNLFVHPAWRNKRIATALMLELTTWLEQNANSHTTVWLHSAETLQSFYKQFGFSEVFGMFRSLNPQKP